ncbi:MATE family efflux transporter [Cupriavidus taiwanensis]|uniref:Na+-driven multidrug efflux system, Multi Antimicrobial Extrusion (MATE) family n=1 Tax=Cupriavidus taiwanensis TaxID=164546 RepID=A0A7Z7J4H2_9BURK|nr:MATE family efflux transporter [Cupriavidus taiwanensis]SOY89574.1 Putative Na+-driven multidrug efflux system, Multi Antimicrobial Extrusion (MATE) family [Cupriavidus taiwanensis]SOZ03405.1 Putative Na+-driven multidrug efflux system, Multi Antimicrobial Extrusion (MATE) family [Cupriavidus taiwanensis]SOZ08942.1 Putative Na+-driven multidrug efflux system, Multi Antimicrobial Extrusion (MATE) family [Cupriavidus taiwanensis]SPC07194.1 Putative Na+-driven multidrug efflux system, Multi Ant
MTDTRALPASTLPADAVPAAEIARRIGKLAGPTALIALLQAVAQLIETWLAARQGTAALAGWAVVLPFALLLQQMSTGAMGGGVVAAIARALGANKRDDASALVMHALWIAVIAGLAFAVVLAGFPRAVLGTVAGATAAEAGATYAIWLFGAGAVPAWLANTLASVLRGGGRHALAARVLALMWIAFPLLSWLLAEPAGMGLAGIGAALAAVSWAAALAMAIVVARGGAGFVPVLRVRLSRPLFARILSVGLVACALASVANLTTILVTAQLRHHGTAAVAAYGISARLEFLMIPLAFGVGSALTALVGRAVGAGDWHTARRTAWVGALLALAIAGTAGAAVGLAPVRFAGLFTNDPEVIAIAARALSWVGPAFGGFGLGMALYFASMGAGRMRWPVAAGLCRIALAAGGGWLLANVFGMGLDGHFLGVALGITAYGVVTALGVRQGEWSAR